MVPATILPTALLLGAVATSADDHRAQMIAGQVMRDEGHLVRAAAVLDDCAAQACTVASADCEGIRAYCKTKGDEVRALVPTIVVLPKDDRGLPLRLASVRVDAAPADASRPIELDPGHHVVRAEYAGRVATAEIEVVAGERARAIPVVLDLRRVDESRPVPWYSYALAGGAGLFGLTAGGFAVATQVEVGSLGACKPTCSPTSKPLFQASTVTVDVTAGVAIVSAAVALVTYLGRPVVKRTTHVEQVVVGGAP